MKRKKKLSEIVINVLLKIIKYVLIIFIILFIIYSFVYNGFKFFGKKEYVKIGSIGILTENNDESMKPEIKTSDLLIVLETQDLKEGDIIVYNNTNSDENSYSNNSSNSNGSNNNSSNGINIKIQRISNITSDNGKTYIITKGDNNLYNNIEKIKENNVVGKVVLAIPVLGTIAKIFQSPYILLFLVITFFVLGRTKIEKNHFRNKKRCLILLVLTKIVNISY